MFKRGLKLQSLHFVVSNVSFSISCPIRVIVGFLRSIVNKLNTRINRPLRPGPIQSIPDRHFSIRCTTALDEVFNTIRIFVDRIDSGGQAKHAIGINLDDRVVDKDVEIERLERTAYVP
jgi:hypothetical protein